MSKSEIVYIDLTVHDEHDKAEIFKTLVKRLGFKSFGAKIEKARTIEIKPHSKAFCCVSYERDGSCTDWDEWLFDYLEKANTPQQLEEDSGGSVDYYKAKVENPTTPELHTNGEVWAECNDVIEALEMTYAEANIFKEVWRGAAARTLGKKKAGHTEKRGAEKIVFFGDRNYIQKVGK